MIQNPVFQEGETGVDSKKEPQVDALESSLAKKRLDNEAEKGRRGWMGRGRRLKAAMRFFKVTVELP